ncbi:hypothetical protein Tco_0534682 [Tanacetum coccineum]
MAGVDVNTLTVKQYLALLLENQASGVVKPEIRGNVNFEIKSQFMRELREDTFSGKKDEDAQDHIDHVFSIVGPIPADETSKSSMIIYHGWLTTIRNGIAIQQAGISEAVVCLSEAKFVEGPRLISDCHISQDVKTSRRGPLGYYTKIDNRPPYGEKRQSLEELLAKHQEESA